MTHRRPRKWFSAAIVAACIPAATVQAKSVLTLYGAEARTPIYATFDRTFREVIGEGAGRLEIYDEYLDNSRFGDGEHDRVMAEYLRRRYAGKPIDVVMTVDPAALRFMKRYRDTMFPGTP